MPKLSNLSRSELDRSLLTTIREGSATFSRAESQVAEWILEHQEATVGCSITELAQAASVSEPTVIRFCRRLGFEGYRHFRTAFIAARTRDDDRYIHRDVSHDDDPMAAATKVFDSAISALMDTRSRCQDMPFATVARLLAQSGQIIFAGIGASGYVAQDAVHKFFRLGLSCMSATDATTIRQYAAIASTSVTVIAISNRGDWADFNRSVEIARNNGANVVAITNPDSALATLAHQLFPCTVIQDASAFTPMNSRLMDLVVLDALQVATALEIGESAADKLRLSKRAINPL